MKIDPQLQSIVKKHFEEELEEKYGRVTITTSYKLDLNEIESITNLFPIFKEKKIDNVIDRSLLGGFIIQFGSKLIDVSIKSLLQSVKQTFYET